MTPGYTYVKPHRRTLPDSNPYNNYSYPGNYNPNTGKITTGNAQTYLDRYYSKPRSSSYSSSNFGLGTGSSLDSTYVSPYYRSTPSVTVPKPDYSPFGTSDNSLDTFGSTYGDSFNFELPGNDYTTPSFDITPSFDAGLLTGSLWDF